MMNRSETNILLKISNIDEDKVINIYRYGSHVYGTNGSQSDIDFIMVASVKKPCIQFHHECINCTVFSEEEFLKLLDEHEITALECISLLGSMIIKQGCDYSKGFEINRHKLRHSLSAKASNSFVKAKKKFTVEADRDIYVGKKSLFHSLRIPLFGIQLSVCGKITDFSVANSYWDQINSCDSEDWNHYHDIYKPVFNNIMSNFRKVAPKV